MTIAEARNAIVLGLEKHIGCTVDLSDQIADQPSYPYCYYSVLTPRISDHAFGLQEIEPHKEGGYTLRRSEPVAATMSFTFCSQNRETEDGGYIFGEDEALELAEKAHGFFLLDGHNIRVGKEEVVIRKVGPVTNRSGFLVEETVRRYGLDIRFAYVRTDEREVTTILIPGRPIGEAHS